MQVRGQRFVPNVLTIVRGFIVIPIVVLLMERTHMASWIAFGAFLLAALTDGADGLLARRWKVVSSTGIFLDPLVDKVLVVIPMMVLVYLHRFPLWAAILVTTREIAVTVLRTAASRKGKGFPASKIGKWKTVAQLTSIAAFVVPSNSSPWVIVRWSFLVIAIGLTLASGIEYFLRAPALLGAE
ncbi:MAG: CDP-diacylglycerol--glycerol-3-phosphate 3-phosphatidyltransferase [Actinomycetota bacterium]